jgi:hypothetical protein
MAFHASSNGANDRQLAMPFGVKLLFSIVVVIWLAIPDVS